MFGPDVLSRDNHLYIGALCGGPFDFEPPVKVTDANHAQNFQESKQLCLEYFGGLPGQTIKGYGHFTNPTDLSWEDLGVNLERDRAYDR